MSVSGGKHEVLAMSACTNDSQMRSVPLCRVRTLSRQHACISADTCVRRRQDSNLTRRLEIGFQLRSPALAVVFGADAFSSVAADTNRFFVADFLKISRHVRRV